jgi:tetratricopeptide (TPR) repeat protein
VAFNEQVSVYRVIVVSPSDVSEERDCIQRIADDLNRTTARASGVRLEVWRWETDSHPGFHANGPQGLIDDLMDVTSSHLVIAIFWKRFGTPTKDSKSGTEHEIRRALTAFESNGSPQIMIYFCERPDFPRSPAEADQLRSVLSFRETLADGLYFTYRETTQFEHLARNHIQMFFQNAVKRAVTSRDMPTQSYELELTPPSFTGQTERHSTLSRIDRECVDHPIVAVEGLPGSGKTFITSEFAQRCGLGHTYELAYWYTAANNGTLDELLITLTPLFKLTGTQETKCRVLVSSLHRQKAILIIDDFHAVDPVSYLPLIDSATRAGNPASLFLVSRTFVDAGRNWPVIGHFELGGFTEAELTTYSEKRGMRLMPEIVSVLLSKTDGLPLAASLFATLVAQFNEDPEYLLAGEMEHDSRLRSWFEELNGRMSEDQRNLLRGLSLYDSPFNRNVVQLVCEHLQISEAVHAFDALLHRYLVQRGTPYRWKVHHLIASLASQELPLESRRDLLQRFGDHCLEGLQIEPERFLSEDDVLSVIRAVRFFQRARRFERSRKLLEQLAPSVKARGLYSLFIPEAEVQVRDDDSRDTWIDYHLAHCYKITGQLQKAFVVAEKLVFGQFETTPDKHSAVHRLYSELLAAAGRLEAALQTIRESLANTDPSTVNAATLEHTRSSEAEILTEMGLYDEAIKVAQPLLVECMESKRVRGVAVARMRLGIIDLRREHLRNAREHFCAAVKEFAVCEDKRGRGWALVLLGEAALRLEDTAEGTKNCLAGIAIYEQLGECSIGYCDTLNRILTLQVPKELSEHGRRELNRVEQVLNRQSRSVF